MVSAFPIIDITFAGQADFADFPTFCAVGGKVEGVHVDFGRSEFTSFLVIFFSFLDPMCKAIWYDMSGEMISYKKLNLNLLTAPNPHKMKFVQTMYLQTTQKYIRYVV